MTGFDRAAVEADRARTFDLVAEDLFDTNPNDPAIRRQRIDYITRGQETIPAHARKKRASDD